MSDKPLFYSVKKAARLLGLLPGDVSRLCNEGHLHAVHQGKVRTVTEASLRAYAARIASQS